MSKCECGCGETANEGKRFIRGHHGRSPEVRARMGAPAKQERNEAIAVRYAVGTETLEEIAADYGITRERVRQLVRKVEKETGFSAHDIRAAIPAPRPPYRPTDLERFFGFVRLDHATGCWEWAGYVDPAGYSRFAGQGAKGYGHRFAVVAFNNPDAYGTEERLHTDHLCRNRGCVNPDHLEVVTCRENVHRSPRWHNGAWDWLQRKSHCHRGHPLEAGNLYVSTSAQGKTSRQCRACNLMYARRRRSSTPTDAAA